MNIFELEHTLPNGFHDSVIYRININYENRMVIFEMGGMRPMFRDDFLKI
jgi:hypothetical protein